MNNCLFTKFMGSVNNDNLPIFEPMAQVTLDAITKGGSMTMTSAQKEALNHFFYAIGAVDNNSLWGKVDMLFMPIIGVDKTKVILDYKREDNYMSINSSYIVAQPGAFEINVNTEPAIQFANPISALKMKNMGIFVLNALSANPYDCGITVTSAKKHAFGQRIDTSVVSKFGYPSSTFTPTISSFPTTFVGEENNIFGSLYNSTDTELTQRILTTAGDNEKSVLYSNEIFNGFDFTDGIPDASNKLRIAGFKQNFKMKMWILFNAGLTDAEVKKLSEAAHRLYDNFFA